jgi:hypothetical protein
MAATGASGPSSVPTAPATTAHAATPATAARGAPRLPSAKNCRITTTNPSTGKPSSGSTHGSVDTNDDTTGCVRRHASGVVVPST